MDLREALPYPASVIYYENISFDVPGRRLLRGVSLRVEAGEKVCLTGPSGCGKSSLMLLLLGRGVPAAGQLEVAGTPVSPATLPAVRRRIAYIAQEHVLGTATVREALLVPFGFKANQHHHPTDRTLEQAVEQVMLPVDILARPVARLSGGERQRVAIARSLLLKRDLFLADEVTSSLDPESRRAVMAALFVDGITMLSVSHDPAWLAACDRVVAIDPERGSLSDVVAGGAGT
jgi:putative ABC transport system ATP-binding protein